MDSLDERIQQALAGATPRSIHSVLFNIAHAYERAGRKAWDELTSTKDADFCGPAVMCQTFAIELLLKFFIASDHPHATKFADLSRLGVNLRGHDLPDLWDRISVAQRVAIAETWSRMFTPALTPQAYREKLTSLGDDPFVRWRYIYESKGDSRLDAELLGRIADSLGKAAERVRKQQSKREPAP